MKLEWGMGNENANILYFPYSPISRFRTPIPPSQKRNAVAPPSPPLPPARKKKTMQWLLLSCPQDSGDVLLLCLGVWPLQDIIDGSFSCIDCWLDLGRFELGVISANIWLNDSRKHVPKRITEYLKKNNYSSLCTYLAAVVTHGIYYVFFWFPSLKNIIKICCHQ